MNAAPSPSIRSRLFAAARPRRLLDGLQRRFRRARPGSVLILVVALLVLLALIGTAFITTAGSDRDSAVQHGYNTEIEMLVQGVKDLIVAQLVEKVAPQSPPTGTAIKSFRPAPAPGVTDPALDPKTAPLNFSNVDTTLWDSILAERYPEPVVSSGTYPNEDEQAIYGIWNVVSASPLGIQSTADPLLYTNQWSSPMVGTDVGGRTVVPQSSARIRMRPAYVEYKDVTGVNRKAPAFQIGYAPDTVAYNNYILAADTDGDGIADAGLFELPVGQINGVRYYAGIRVVDNSAAVNASIAMERMPASGLAADQARLATNVFPTNVDFRRMVEGPEYPASPMAGTDTTADANGVTPWDNLNWYRFGYSGVSSPGALPELGMQRDDNTTDPNFQFATRYDAFWTMLGSRLDNPGRNNTAGGLYRALGLSESINLANRFCMANPSGSSSNLETFLPHGLKTIAAINRQPYTPDQAPTWFQGIFDYDYMQKHTPSEIPLRPLLVGYNPTTNDVPGYNLATPITDEDIRRGRYQYRGTWAAGQTYQTGDWVIHSVPPNAYSPQRGTAAFVCVQNHASAVASEPVVAGAGATDPAVPDLVHWAEVPWTTNPVKLNPNTASFGALYAAYSAVMADGPRARPTGGSVAAADYGAAFPADEYWTFGNVLRPVSGGSAERFLDSSGTAAIRRQNSGYMVRQLRAAIAAVNTIDLRDQDDDVTSRTVTLMPKAGGTARTVQVYGTERQPVITEACVNYDQATGQRWVMVELFNPNPAPISLAAFRFAYRGRDTGDMTVVEIAQPTTPSAMAGATIGAYQYAYFESASGNRPMDIAADPQMDTTLTGAYQVPDLAQLLVGNRELFLMRTRSYSGTKTSNADPANTFNETANAADLVPVDQLEFVGVIQRQVPHGMATDPVTTRYHYRRANAATGGGTNRWHSVYGGPYNPTPPAGERRQRGWISDRDPGPSDPTDPNSPLEPSPVRLPGFGRDKTRVPAVAAQTAPADTSYPATASTFRTRTFQVAALGAAGPWSPVTARRAAEGGYQPNYPVYFPAGGFLRTGDLLAVTYAGNYRIDPVPATGAGTPPPDDALPEFNSVTMDAAFVEDGDSTDDDTAGGTGAGFPLEQLGRFAPIKFGTAVDDLKDRPGFDPLAPPADVRYHWAIDLFDYFSVVSPQDDWAPNIDPNGYMAAASAGNPPVRTSGDPTLAGVTPANTMIRKWPPETAGNTDFPRAVPNGPKARLTDDANFGREDASAVHGLVNINTANPKVISLLPFTEDPARNRVISQQILQYRRTVGPIRNLFELNNIAAVAQAYGNLDSTGFNPGLLDGDVSPLDASLTSPPGAAGETVQNDFEARYLVLNRISNMVSFRSDSFTAYVLVQGWRNAGTKSPELVVQRRAAMIVDRSTVRPKLKAAPGEVGVSAPTIINVPTD